ncbi:tetraacyldisaccharide 4'-kinase [Abyssibacter sp.]|jgi:tetraacyldisaccharide 4'-kinase|uniref:tetraacyldisaccharide 4'-kinase n=1 Tax=Abyssibacter sp. TaxID=2320200 RepID=UPI0025B99B65|nr:tetraacyldisaccharide 4'-kinase [Abyssibacter sp.]MCK5859649.1 tetraacyldisaccharide 4'-kinase [Abyssibacter sp.]
MSVVENAWQTRWHPLSLFMLPWSWLFALIAAVRRLAYRRGWLTIHTSCVPVLVVGNVTVGGVGKTPLVLWLANRIRARGLTVGVVSRGYGRATQGLRIAHACSTADEIGDEPLLFAQAGFPVAVAERRADAVAALAGDVNLVIADDGLQHYAMQRAAEIVVVDGDRGFGNGRRLPAGPLREPLSRLHAAALVLVRNGVPQQVLACSGVSGHRFDVDAATLQSLDGLRSEPLARWSDRRVHAVAGIGYPERFFAALRDKGLDVIAHPFADHHRYRPEELQFGDGLPVLMTGKDAVKCRDFAQPDWWSVEIAIRMQPELEAALDALVQELAGQPAQSPVFDSENARG